MEWLQSSALCELGYTAGLPLAGVAASQQLPPPPPIFAASQQLLPPQPRAAETSGVDTRLAGVSPCDTAAPSSHGSSCSSSQLQDAVPNSFARGVSPAGERGSRSGLGAAGQQASAAASAAGPSRRARGRRRQGVPHTALATAAEAGFDAPVLASVATAPCEAQEQAPETAREAAAAGRQPESLSQAHTQVERERAAEEVMVQLLMFNAARDAQLFTKVSAQNSDFLAIWNFWARPWNPRDIVRRRSSL